LAYWWRDTHLREKPNTLSKISGRAHDDPTELCLPDGHPREVLAPYAAQIIQTLDTVMTEIAGVGTLRVNLAGGEFRNL
jgi:hypothetical protein